MAGAMRDRTLQEIAAYRDERLVELLRIVGSQLGSPVVKPHQTRDSAIPPHEPGVDRLATANGQGQRPTVLNRKPCQPPPHVGMPSDVAASSEANRTRTPSRACLSVSLRLVASAFIRAPAAQLRSSFCALVGGQHPRGCCTASSSPVPPRSHEVAAKCLRACGCRRRCVGSPQPDPRTRAGRAVGIQRPDRAARDRSSRQEHPVSARRLGPAIGLPPVSGL